MSDKPGRMSDAKVRAILERACPSGDDPDYLIYDLATDVAALRSENETLRAVLEEMREATALAVRILHAEGLGDEFLSECRRLGIKEGIGLRARAALEGSAVNAGAALRSENERLRSILRVALKSTESDCNIEGTRPFPWFREARAALGEKT